MAKIEKIRKFLETCNLLKNGKIKVDYLDSKIYSYSIEVTPSNPIVKTFVDGRAKKQITFDFLVQSPTNRDDVISLKNSDFFEDFQEWINKKNNMNVLPEIEGAFSIECASPGYIIERNGTTSVYVIQMIFYYYE